MQKNNRFQADVNLNTFKSNKYFFILFIYYNKETLDTDSLWLIPSTILKSKGGKINLSDGKKLRRISANPKKSKDRWDQYKVTKQNIGITLINFIKSAYKKKDI